MTVSLRRLLGILSVLAIFCAAAQAATPAEAPKEVTLVHWNVENLFDTNDDPANKGDDPYTLRGWEHWTPALYQKKLAHLATLLKQMNGDIVCVAEVENRQVLEDLNRTLSSMGAQPYTNIVHREGPDKRGIDVAILSRYPALNARWISPVPMQRDILVADFLVSGHPLTVMANHWKSQSGPKKETARMRETEAIAARGAIDAILATNRMAAIVMAGDFNNNFDSTNMLVNARTLPDLQATLADKTGNSLFNLHATLPEDRRGTLFYAKAKVWDSFDSISVSRSMVDAENKTYRGWRVKPGSYEVFRAKEHVDKDGHPTPFRRGLDPEDDDPARRPYIEGYSDHFPVRVILKID